MVICLEQSANDLHMVQLICLCHCHPHQWAIIACFIKIEINLTFLVLAYPGCFGNEAIKQVSVYLFSLYCTSL